MASASDLASIQASLAREGSLEPTRVGDTVVVTRRRLLPSRGIVRLLFPKAVAKVRLEGGTVVSTVLPDGFAWTMIVVALGGLVVEATMDRATYPREYPPAAVFFIASVVVVSTIVDVVLLRGALAKALPRRGA